MVILYFFAAHYLLSIFCQTFFLHRYSAHRMFTMGPRWERFFYFLTYISLGASYLNPRGYALLHRRHHAFSDTPKDPHTPTMYSNVFTMMWATKIRYEDIYLRMEKMESRFDGGYPVWPFLDKIVTNRLSIVAWLLFYVAVYAMFATAWWQWAFLLPIQFLMGPVHGAIVNWCGHKYGYRNFDVSDQSRNTLVFDIFAFGELFQNNHHRFCSDPNFAKRWFEIDPCYQIIRVLVFFGIVQLNKEDVPYLNGAEEELSWGVPYKNAKEA